MDRAEKKEDSQGPEGKEIFKGIVKAHTSQAGSY